MRLEMHCCGLIADELGDGNVLEALCCDDDGQNAMEESWLFSYISNSLRINNYNRLIVPAVQALSFPPPMFVSSLGRSGSGWLLDRFSDLQRVSIHACSYSSRE